jgi:hypothetical protein
MPDLPEVRRTDVGLSRQDYAANAGRGLVKMIPWFGEGLEQFIWGPAEERRRRRLEQTLTEMADAIHRLEADDGVQTERFANMLEATAPLIARATNEDKRSRLRDLLVNAAQLEEDDQRWEEADLARELIAEIEGPGLAIMAALGRTPEAFLPPRGGLPVPDVHLVSRPEPQLIRRQMTWDEEDWSSITLAGERIGYDWTVIEEWARRLREKRLMLFRSHDARGAFGGVHLTSLGQMLVRWALQSAEVDHASPNNTRSGA